MLSKVQSCLRLDHVSTLPRHRFQLASSEAFTVSTSRPDVELSSMVEGHSLVRNKDWVTEMFPGATKSQEMSYQRVVRHVNS